MLRKIVFTLMAAVALIASPQSKDKDKDTRAVVGVAQFTCDEKSPYTGLVTEKVVEMLTNTRRFRVVDRTSDDKIRKELELQKSEGFMDSENRVEQDIAVSAEKMVTGHIVKIPVYAMKNADGSRRGYKASVGFEMKVVDVATGLSSEATSFQGKASKECLSPEAAVTMAMQDVQGEIEQWFKVNFPITAKVTRALDDKTIIIKAGSAQGVSVGDTFLVEAIEEIDGDPFHRKMGEIKISRVAGRGFSECNVPKKMMTSIKDCLDNAVEVLCTLKIEKK